MLVAVELLSALLDELSLLLGCVLHALCALLRNALLLGKLLLMRELTSL